jgi:hypothetical protein
MIVVDWLPYSSSINHDHEKCLLMPHIKRAQKMSKKGKQGKLGKQGKRPLGWLAGQT